MASRRLRFVSRTCALCHKGKIRYNFGIIQQKEVNRMRKIVTLLLCLLLTAAPAGAVSVMVDGVPLESDIDPVVINSTTYVPLRAAAEALREDASLYYKEDELYWLSRIISAESRGEPLLGKIAVGNVVLNRAEHKDFPATIYGVIFDDRWGGQFEPVSNGTVYQTPTEESVLAARLVLDGADVAGESLYFLAPILTNNHWIIENKTFVMRIGAHWFYR